MLCSEFIPFVTAHKTHTQSKYLNAEIKLRFSEWVFNLMRDNTNTCKTSVSSKPSPHEQCTASFLELLSQCWQSSEEKTKAFRHLKKIWVIVFFLERETEWVCTFSCPSLPSGAQAVFSRLIWSQTHRVLQMSFATIKDKNDTGIVYFAHTNSCVLIHWHSWHNMSNHNLNLHFCPNLKCSPQTTLWGYEDRLKCPDLPKMSSLC